LSRRTVKLLNVPFTLTKQTDCRAAKFGSPKSGCFPIVKCCRTLLAAIAPRLLASF
jgi:hypothetical protein